MGAFGEVAPGLISPEAFALVVAVGEGCDGFAGLVVDLGGVAEDEASLGFDGVGGGIAEDRGEGGGIFEG